MSTIQEHTPRPTRRRSSAFKPNSKRSSRYQATPSVLKRRRSLQTAASLNASIPEKNEKCWAQTVRPCRRSRFRCLSKYTRKFGVLADRRPQAVGGSVLWAYNEGGLLGVVGVFWGNFNGYSVKIRAAEGSRWLCKCHIRGVN